MNFNTTGVGYYKQRNGKIAKVLHVLKNTKEYSFVGISDFGTYSELLNSWCKNGDALKSCDYRAEDVSDFDLVSFIGQELPKEPRIIEFVADLNLAINPDFFGEWKYTIHVPKHLISKDDTDKWRVKMEEILE